MIHPDQIYTVRQLRHDDLQAEAQQARVRWELADNRPAGGRVLAWLLRLGTSWRRGAIPTSRAGSGTSTGTV
jgi:hypothetical protein